jgi:hypothetical protein
MKFKVDFDHRGGKKNESFGKVGSVDVEILDADLEPFTGAIWLNGEAVSAKVAEYLIAYGVRQSCGDSYAAAKSLSEAQGLLAKRLDNIIKGTIGTRAASPASQLDKEILRVAMEVFRKRTGKTFAAVEKQVGKDKAKALFEKFLEANRESFTATARANIESIAALDVGLDLDAALGITDSDDDADEDGEADETETEEDDDHENVTE